MKTEYVGDSRDNTNAAPTWKRKTATIAGAHFSSPEAMVRWLKSPEGEQEKWCSEGRTSTQDPDFYGASWSDACKMVIDGWQAGAEKAQALRDRINASNPTARRNTRYSVAGPQVDIGRYLSGNPMHMRCPQTDASRKRPVITIVSHYGATADVEAQHMMRRAAVVAAVVDAIEASGFSVHLIAWTASHDHSETVAETSVVLKDAGQAVDLPRLAFGLGHAAMFRRLTFATRASRTMSKPLGTGMGSTIYDNLTMPEGCYLLPAIQYLGESKFGSDDRAATEGLQAVIEALKAQGCPAFQD